MFILEWLLTRIGFVFAFLVTPWLATRATAPQADRVETLARAALAALLLNIVVPLVLFAGAFPVSPLAIATGHLLIGLPAVLLFRRRKTPLLPPGSPDDRIPLLLAALWTLLAMPVTYLAGIDTYKWQDLADMTALEHTIPWLIHPLSLFGLTPGACPAAQPLVLASAQMLSGVYVDGGYAVVSILSALLGVTASACLARRLFNDSRLVNWAVLLYAFSPVFARYNHWATGRGLFLALLPLFVLALLEPRPLRRFGRGVLCGIGLLLCHKAALVAVVLYPLSMAGAHAWPRRLRGRGTIWTGAGLAFLVALFLVRPRFFSGATGAVAGLFYTMTVRFGIAAPLALLALWPRSSMDTSPWPALFTALLPLGILAVGPMYGAMAALPIVVLFAARGLHVGQTWPGGLRRIIHTGVTCLALLSACGIVTLRSLHATPASIRDIARCLQQHDPQGPFRIDAPDPIRTRIQAYVQGSPRFHYGAETHPRFRVRPPPKLIQAPGRLFDDWTAWLRNIFVVSGVDFARYGKSPVVYAIRARGTGLPPPRSQSLYESGDIVLYGPEHNEDNP